MTDAKHTPGPWTATRISARYGTVDWLIEWKHTHAGEERIIARLQTDDEEMRANAHLIAAAPDLLEALHVLYSETKDYIELNHLGDAHHNQSMKMAQAAIAKAVDREVRP